MRDDDTGYFGLDRGGGQQVDEALDCLRDLVVDGLKHGYFDFRVRCETGKNGRRLLIIAAGKSHKFSILKEDLPR